MINTQNEVQEPYYTSITSFPLTNTEKGRLGEEAFNEALPDFPVLMNITYDKKQKDIDHLVFTNSSLIMNECKNIKEDFVIYDSWFMSRVVSRFLDGLSIAQTFADEYGYEHSDIVYTFTIPQLNTDPIVLKRIEELHVHVIETRKQLLSEEDKKDWYEPVRSQILSVINTRTSNYSSSSISYSSDSSIESNSNDKADSQSGNSITINTEDELGIKQNANVTVPEDKAESVITGETVKDLLQICQSLLFPLDKAMEIYLEEREKLLLTEPIVAKYDLLLRRTRLRIKTLISKTSKCDCCLERVQKGCTLYLLHRDFSRLYERTKAYSKTNDNEELNSLLYDISKEFIEVRNKAISCVRRKLFQNSKLEIKTMDYNLQSNDDFKPKSFQQSFNPMEDIKKELDRLRKERRRMSL